MKRRVSAIVVTRDRQDVLDLCLQSLLASTRKPDQIIVVDNASTDNTCAMVKQKYPSALLIQNDHNLFLAESRNMGMKRASGDYLLLVDDDNEVDPRMIEELVALCESDRAIGIVGPKMYFYGMDKLILFAGATIDPVTSRAVYRGASTVDVGQFDTTCETGHIPNLFMVTREVCEKIGGFDETYKQTYADSDFPMRAKLAGYKVMYCPKAVTYHKVLPPTTVERNDSNVTPFRSSTRAYYMARNRVFFMKRFSGKSRFFVFFSVFFPLLTLYYTLKCIGMARHSRLQYKRNYSALKMHLIGSLHGFIYGMGGKLKNYYDRRPE